MLLLAVVFASKAKAPTYEPLAQRNVRVDFAYRLRAGQRLIVFKADADQDRPNRIEEPCTTAARS